MARSVSFNCGTTSERMKGNNYNFEKLLCEACIIHENSYLSETSLKTLVLRLPRKVRQKLVFGESEEQRSGTSGVCDEQVKLKRAQGECLGIRSRRRT